MKNNNLYTIEWIVNGTVKDELNKNNPRPINVINAWIATLQTTTHKTGVLRPKIVIK